MHWARAIACTLTLSALLTPAATTAPQDQQPPWQTSSFTVPPGESKYVSLNLNLGGRIQGYFTISGGNNDVGFSTQNPSGGLLGQPVTGLQPVRLRLPDHVPERHFLLHIR